VEPDYIICPPDLDSMLLTADAALLIGDIALKHYVDAKDFYLYDLGGEWKRLTGKKMVYAVWAVNRPFAETRQRLGYVFNIFRNQWIIPSASIGDR
jgi:chorismate dehydratase